jgi:hypothetical protein
VSLNAVRRVIAWRCTPFDALPRVALGCNMSPLTTSVCEWHRVWGEGEDPHALVSGEGKGEGEGEGEGMRFGEGEGADIGEGESVHMQVGEGQVRAVVRASLCALWGRYIDLYTTSL